MVKWWVVVVNVRSCPSACVQNAGLGRNRCSGLGGMLASDGALWHAHTLINPPGLMLRVLRP